MLFLIIQSWMSFKSTQIFEVSRIPKTRASSEKFLQRESLLSRSNLTINHDTAFWFCCASLFIKQYLGERKKCVKKVFSYFVSLIFFRYVKICHSSYEEEAKTIIQNHYYFFPVKKNQLKKTLSLLLSQSSVICFCFLFEERLGFVTLFFKHSLRVKKHYHITNK